MNSMYLRAFLTGTALLICSVALASEGSISKDELKKKWNSFIDENEQYEAIKLHEPEGYERILDIIDRGVENGSSKQQIIWEIRRISLSLEQKYVPLSSLEVMEKYMKFAVDQIDYLVKQGNGSCVDLLDENVNTVTVLKTLPKDLMNRGILLSEAIESALKNDYRLPDESEVLPILITIFDRLQAKYGTSFDIALDDPRDPNLEAEDVCVMFRQLFVDLLELPVAEREKALRYMTSP